MDTSFQATPHRLVSRLFNKDSSTRWRLWRPLHLRMVSHSQDRIWLCLSRSMLLMEPIIRTIVVRIRLVITMLFRSPRRPLLDPSILAGIFKPILLDLRLFFSTFSCTIQNTAPKHKDRSQERRVSRSTSD